jgi:RNA polymerase sigma-70 factor (ECF subfamily)
VHLRRLLAEADEQQARAAIYVYLDGMSHEEAAAVLGVSKRTVGNLIDRFLAWANQRSEKAGTKK